MQGLPEIGDILDGNYEILSQLGAGGFGAVFLANHIPMDREVALKMLLAHGPRPEEMVERFRREVMATRVLSHPNTVRIFDYKDREDHLLYYTMEHLKGDTLKHITKTFGPQSPRRVRHIAKQVLKSLSEAHSYKIVHRDLKPANIMLVDMHGETDFVKVLDFGIAKIMDTSEGENEEDQLTSAGMLVGTLRYMAPEQITGAPLGPMTDLYSLGLIMTELLVGKSVFAGTGRWEVFQKQISEDPIDLPAPVLQSPLGPILSKALSKRADQRYASALEMIEALEEIPASQLSQEPLMYADGSQFGVPDSNISKQFPHSGAFSTSAISSSGPIPTTPAFNESAPTMVQDVSEVSRADHVRVPAHAGVHVPTSEETTQHLDAHDLAIMDVSEQAPAPAFSPGSAAPIFSPPSDDTFDNGSKGKLMVLAGVGVLLLIGGVIALATMGEEEPSVEQVEPTMAAIAPESKEDPQQIQRPEPTPVDPPAKQLDKSAIAAKANPEEAAPDKVEPVKVKPAPVQPKTFKVNISSTPSRARVSLRGKRIGVTPFTYEYTKPVNVLVSMNGYKSKAVSLEEDGRASINVNLTKKKTVVRPKPTPGPGENNDSGFVNVLKEKKKKEKKGGFMAID